MSIPYMAENANIPTFKRIETPMLNHAEFGKALLEQFQNIDFNFQKLASLDINKGLAGKSCQYVTINFMAPFVFEASKLTNATTDNYNGTTFDYNAFQEWKEYFEAIKASIGEEKWNELEASATEDFNQFHNLTGLEKEEYTRIACKLLWGYSVSFIETGDKPTDTSLTGAIAARYGKYAEPFKCKFGDTEYEFSGNWLYDIFCQYAKEGATSMEIPSKRADILATHLKQFTPGRLIVAISPSSDGDGELSYYPVGSMAYWHIDPRFRNAATSRPKADAHDVSCVLHWTPDNHEGAKHWEGHFEVLEVFPTIRLGADGKYYWFINGYNTGIPVQGDPGKDGANAKMLVVQRIENVIGYDPYKNAHGTEVVVPYFKKDERTQANKAFIPLTAFSGSAFRTRSTHIAKTTDIAADFPADPLGQYVESKRDKSKDAYPVFSNVGAPVMTNVSGRTHIVGYEVDVDKANCFLSSEMSFYNDIEPNHLFRIYRISGREKLWKAKDGRASVIPAVDDFLCHMGDPSCDKYYYNENDVSVPDDSTDIQNLIEELDGAMAIVLPGPAYQQDRTDTAFWITTLKKVKHNNGSWMLVAYCSPEEQITNALDEHTHAGMMQRLDAYTYKSPSDNRNKPRGLMLPIGSAEATLEDDMREGFAAHIIHADCGGFSGFIETELKHGKDTKNILRGIQTIPEFHDNVRTYGGLIKYNTPTDVEALSEAQFNEVINKRFLHIGSVNDYRALNYVPNDKSKKNGGIPGREFTDGETLEVNTRLNNGIPAYTPADYFGWTRTDTDKWLKVTTGDYWSNDVGEEVVPWWVGSELHVDEPVTITRYRDLHNKRRLLNVEGDVVIGPRYHANGPEFRYNQRDGGLVVQSTISEETGRDTRMYNESSFSANWFNGFALPLRQFGRNLIQPNDEDINRDWGIQLRRWHYTKDSYRGIYEKDNRVITENSKSNTANYKDKVLFSILADDTIGARMIVVQDGIAIYNPELNKVNDPLGDESNENSHVAFSVDAMGNIQTQGSEIRSNSDDTLWSFHTRWLDKTFTYPSDEVLGIMGGSWAPKTKDNKIVTFSSPKHNMLRISTDHEIQIPVVSDDVYNPETGKLEHNIRGQVGRWWRATNWAPRKSLLINGGPSASVICNIPYGYLYSLGPQMRSGYSTGAFNFYDELESFGTSEYMPIICIHTSDINMFYGSLATRGVSPIAIFSPTEDVEIETKPMYIYPDANPDDAGYDKAVEEARAKLKAQEEDYWVRARFGQEVACGMIIGDARNPIRRTGGNGGDGTFTKQDYLSDTLQMKYKATHLPEKYAIDDSSIELLGFGDTELFVDEVPGKESVERYETLKIFTAAGDVTPIGLWVRSGVYINKSLIINHDMITNRAATVRGQIRAKSFRRHLNALNYNSSWAFLLDDGKSSTCAPMCPFISGNKTEDKTLHTNGFFRKFDFETHRQNAWYDNVDIQSPITFDLGSAYGPARIVKFGVAAGVKTTQKNGKYELEIKQAGAAGEDRQNILLGANPFESQMTFGKSCYLYKKSGSEAGSKKRYHAMKVTGIVNNLFASVSFTVNMDKQFRSRDNHHGGWFHAGSKHYTYSYGFLWQDQSPDEECDVNSCGKTSCVCDGFDWEKILTNDFPRPSTDQYVFVASLHDSSKDHNWNIKGSKSARDRQYGVWFRLTTEGKLEIAAANCPGTMCAVPQTITLTFTYPAPPEQLVTRKYLVRFTDTPAIPDATNYDKSTEDNEKGYLYAKSGNPNTPASCAINSLSDLPDDWKTASIDKPYIWIKTYVGYNGSEIDWDSISWALWKAIPTEEYLAYYLVKKDFFQNGVTADTFPFDSSGNWTDRIINNDKILGVLDADSSGKPRLTDSGCPAIVYPCLIAEELEVDDYGNPVDTENATEIQQWLKFRDNLTAALQTNDEAYYIVRAIVSNNYKDPHKNECRRGLIKRRLNDKVNWELWLTKEQIDSVGEGSGQRIVSTDKAFATDDTDTTWFAGKTTNGDFLSSTIGKESTIPQNCVINAFDWTIEQAGGLTIATLRIAGDKRKKAGQGANVAGIKLGGTDTSKFSVQWQPTNAKLPSSVTPPKYDLWFRVPGMKPVKGAKDNNEWDSSRSKGKGIEGDGDKQDTLGIDLVLKTDGTVFIPYAVNPGVMFDPKNYTGNGDQPYIMVRWFWPSDENASSGGLIQNNLYMLSTGMENNQPAGTLGAPSLTAMPVTSQYKYLWIKSLRTSSQLTADDKLWNGVQWKLHNQYSAAGSGTGGGDDTSTAENWMWANVTAPTATTLGTWLNDELRSSIKEVIDTVLNGANGEISNATSNYGQCTVRKIDASNVEVSLIVTAYKGGATDLSHRSINFQYSNAGTISNLSTYIIGDTVDDVADSDDDVTKLTVVDLAMPGVDRTKSWFQQNLQSIFGSAVSKGSITAADISSSTTRHRRITLFGPGGYITFEFRGHENVGNDNWNVQVNGQITSNILAPSGWAGCIMMFGSSSQFRMSGNTISDWICNTCYYSNGPVPTYL